MKTAALDLLANLAIGVALGAGVIVGMAAALAVLTTIF
jgi:hypothetical protein